MALLEIALLGNFQVRLDGTELTDFEADSARLLLAYLAMHAGTHIRREFLASLFWPEQPAAVALHNLRSALNRVRNVLGERETESRFLSITRATLAFNPSSEYALDVALFARAMESVEKHGHRRLEGCPFCLRRLRQAAELYRGDFLSGLSIESIGFGEWATVQRELFHRQALDACFVLAETHLQRGEFGQAQRYAQKQIALEAWREEAHRQLMTALAATGQRTAALAQFGKCQAALERELDVAPEAKS